MTPRSYSRATLIAEIRKSTTRKSRTATRTRAAAKRVSFYEVGTILGDACFFARLHGLHVEHEAVLDLVDPDPLARAQRLAVAAAGLPELAAEEDEAPAAHLADLTDERAGAADCDGPPAHLDRLAQREGPDRAEHDRERDDQEQVRMVGLGRVSEQHRHPDGEADQPGDGERAVACHVRVDHEQRDAEQKQREAGPADRQDREAEERRQQ